MIGREEFRAVDHLDELSAFEREEKTGVGLEQTGVTLAGQLDGFTDLTG